MMALGETLGIAPGTNENAALILSTIGLDGAFFYRIGLSCSSLLHSSLVFDFGTFTSVFGRNIKYPRQSTAVTCWPEVLDGGGPEVDVSR